MPSEPIAVQPSVEEGVLVELYSLQRVGDTVRATIALHNEGTESYTVLGLLSGRQSEFDLSGLRLLDPVGLQRYYVLLDAEEECLCSELGGTQIAPGERVFGAATFPAPPDDVTTVTLETPAASFAGVPIAEEP